MGLPRISGRRGQDIDLNVTFLRNGQPTNPYAIRKIEIYKTQVLPHNLIATIPVVDPTESLYPAPVEQLTETAETGDCCTEPESDTEALTGQYKYVYAVPSDLTVPDVFFDVWYYFADNPCDVTDCDLDDYEDQLLNCCHRFWLYPDGWFCDDGLQTVRFAFEPLDQKFHAGETRPLEVGLMPLPLYDYNVNLVNPLIPYLQATLSAWTLHGELLIDAAAMTIGLRQGSYRTNPWVLRYNLNTSNFLKGTYQYNIKLTLPDGSTRVSKKFIFTVG